MPRRTTPMPEEPGSSGEHSFAEESGSPRDSNYTISPAGSPSRGEAEREQSVQALRAAETAAPVEGSKRGPRKARARRTKPKRKEPRSGQKKVYLYSLPEDFALLEQLFSFREAQQLSPALTRNEFFSELAQRLQRGLASVLHRMEKLEQSGEPPLCIIYFFCRKFREQCFERRLFVSRRSDEVRVTMKDSASTSIPAAEQQFVDFVQRSVGDEAAGSAADLHALFAQDREEEARNNADSILGSSAFAHYVESLLIARMAAEDARTPAASSAREQASALSAPTEVGERRAPPSTSKDAPPRSPRQPSPSPDSAQAIKAQLMITHALNPNERFLVDFLLGKICAAFGLSREDLLREIGVSL